MAPTVTDVVVLVLLGRRGVEVDFGGADQVMDNSCATVVLPSSRTRPWWRLELLLLWLFAVLAFGSSFRGL